MLSVIIKHNPYTLRMIVSWILEELIWIFRSFGIMSVSDFGTDCWTMWCVTIARSAGGAFWQRYSPQHCDALTWWPVSKTILSTVWSCWAEVRSYTEVLFIHGERHFPFFLRNVNFASIYFWHPNMSVEYKHLPSVLSLKLEGGTKVKDWKESPQSLNGEIKELMSISIG